MKSILYISVFLIIYFFYGLYINQFDLSIVEKQLSKDSPEGYFDYKGIINVHTTHSLGSSSPTFILDSAKQANLDFILFTDLNNFEEKNYIEDGYYNGVMALWGNKVSYLDSRLIYYNQSKASLGSNLGEAQIKFADLLTQSAPLNKESLNILAHPKGVGFNWKGELPIGLDGLELINIKSIADSTWLRSKLSTLWSILIYPFNSRLALIRLFTEPEDISELYDQETQKRPFNAYAGAEASARAIPLTGYIIKFPTYLRNFEIASNHVLLNSELTGDFNADRKKVFNALKQGNFYLAFDIIGDPKGFLATMNDGKKSYPMGSSIPMSKNLNLKIQVPNIKKDFFEVIILHNGQKLKIFNQNEILFPIEKPGVYRVQVRVSPLWPLPDAVRWVSWIYSNSFYVDSGT